MLRTSLPPTTARGALRFPISSSRTSIRPSTSQTDTPLRTLTRRTYTSPSNPRSSSTGFTFSSGRPSFQNPTLLQRLRNSFRSLHNSRLLRNGKPVSPNVTENLGSAGGKAAEAEPTGLMGRMKKLGREYGWSAMGVYFALSAIDLPLCYLLVGWLGTDRIGEWEFLLQQLFGVEICSVRILRGAMEDGEDQADIMKSWKPGQPPNRGKQTLRIRVGIRYPGTQKAI